MPDEPVLVLRVGQRMIVIKDVYDGLLEAVYWDEERQQWKPDTGSLREEIAAGLNRLKYKPPEEPLP